MNALHMLTYAWCYWVAHLPAITCISFATLHNSVYSRVCFGVNTERKTACFFSKRKKFRTELRNFFNQSFVIGLGSVSQFFCLESEALFQKIDLKRREDIVHLHALTETLKLLLLSLIKKRKYNPPQPLEKLGCLFTQRTNGTLKPTPDTSALFRQ